MNKISVIVPIYNTSLYLEECINSIVNQTYTNIEIILINDGSTDRSLEICHKLSKCDKRIKVLDKEHTGIADSRNVGLNNASGEFISFIDSDDYISNDMYENMIRYMEKYDLDIAEGINEIVKQQKAIGRNLNQIATLANMDRVTAVNFQPLLDEHTNVTTMIGELLRAVK